MNITNKHNRKDVISENVKKSETTVPDSIEKSNGETKSQDKYNRRRFIYVALALIVTGMGLAIVFIFLNYSKNSVAIKVGNVQLSKKDYSEISAEYTKHDSPLLKDENQLKDFIVDVYKTRQVVDKFDIAVSEKEIQEYARGHYNKSQNDTLTKYQLIVGEKLAYDEKIAIIKEGKRRVAYIDVPFSKNFAAGQQISANENNQPATFGNQTEIANDKKLAKETVEKYHESMKTNLTQQNAQKIIDEIKNNKVLSYGMTKNESEIFYVSDDGFVATPSMNIGIGGADMAEISKIDKVTPVLVHKEGKNFSEIAGYNINGVEVSYYFYADLGKNVNKDIIKQIDEIKKDIKVKINV